MTTDVKGFISNENEIYKKHSLVLKACINADIKELPKETAEYFNSKYPDNYLFEEKLEIEIPIHDYCKDSEEGYEIIVSEIPEGVYKIRFVNSY